MGRARFHQLGIRGDDIAPVHRHIAVGENGSCAYRHYFEPLTFEPCYRREHVITPGIVP